MRPPLHLRRGLGWCLLLGGLAGCDPTSEASAAVRPAPPKQPVVATATDAAQAQPAPPAPAPRPPLVAGQVIEIAAGSVRLGSVPGTPERDASREGLATLVQLGAFRMDRLPYPNDPAQPPLTQITRDEAEQKCAESGKRLCTEIEWERACEAGHDLELPFGGAWDAARCSAARDACDSPLGVSELGTRMREWTRSTSDGGFGVSARTAITRGGTIDAPVGEHRCSARAAATPDSRSESIGFRCCAGDIAAVEYPEPTRLPTLTALAWDDATLRSHMQRVPELAGLAANATLVGRGDPSRALARGGRSSDSLLYWTLAPSALEWSPVRGEKLLVFAAHVEAGILLAALYPFEGKLIHGASAVLKESDAPLALASRSDDPSSLMWTTCYGCFGESGRITIGSDRRVTIEFH